MAKASIKKPTRASQARNFAEGKAAGSVKASRAPAGSQELSGQVPTGDVRLTANIREDLHLRLKIEAARQRTTIGELVEGLIDKHIP